jgi:hypothetical protein
VLTRNSSFFIRPPSWPDKEKVNAAIRRLNAGPEGLPDVDARKIVIKDKNGLSALLTATP